MRADMGVMITASHNGFADNGIKLFSPDGYKLPDDVEMQLEALMDNATTIPLCVGKEVGRAKRIDDAPGRYVEFCKSTLPKDFRLDGMKIVLDCANGATYHVARSVFWELGAEVELIHVSPNGQNINEACGSLHPEDLQMAVRAHKADVGLAFDGDGDRVIMVDEQGAIVEGDQMLGAIALNWQKTGRLKQNTVVATIITNAGLEKRLSEAGITMIRAQVGDRYVTEMLRKEGLNFGGEPNGHIICADYNTCGDAIVAGLQALKVMRDEGCKASDLGKTFKPYPQKMENIRLGEGLSADSILGKVQVKEAVVETEKMLAGKGRMVLRKSGTEPLIRLMIEAETDELLNRSLNSMAEVIRSAAV
jgi:phosphoglucosamine mutase